MESLIAFVKGLTLAEMIGYFWPFFILDMVRYVVIEFFAVIRYQINKAENRPKLRKARTTLFNEKPLVSVVVPGKNEGKHIPRLVESLTGQTYQNYEVIVVDDGSDDETPYICRRLEQLGKIKKFIRNDIRGGKASGANTALLFSKGKYIVHIDADSHLANDAIENLLLPFYSTDDVGAVGGDVRVSNEMESFATTLQAVEYYKTISTGRVTSSELGILRIISGAHGAFRRDILDRLGGWDVGPGLDGDITLKIRKLGYKVVHAVDAICETNVPVTFRKLAKQRYRWDKSMIRFRLRKHLDILLPGASFDGKNFISVLENLVFNLLFDIKWFIYIGYLIYTAPDYFGLIFVINYILYFIANVLQFLLVSTVIGVRKINWELFLYLPLMPLYTGLYLRAVRTYAYLMELFHKTSYDDPWNPWKVSSIAKKNRL